MKFLQLQSMRRPASLAGAAVLTVGLAVGLPTAPASAAGLPSASAVINNNTLTVRGTNRDDAVVLGLVSDAGGQHLSVDLGGGSVPILFDRNLFTAIAVQLGSGDDSFSVIPDGGFLDTPDPITVDGGSGNDVLVGSFGDDTLSGGAGDDRITGQDGEDLILGGQGNDTVNGNRGNDIEILGAGDDTALWTPGEGSDAVDGGGGVDQLLFDGSNAPENVRVTASGSHVVFTRDVAAVRMDLQRVEGLTFRALGSADVITIGDLTGTALRKADLDLRSSTGEDDGAVDAITVAGSGRADWIEIGAPVGSIDIAGTPAEVGIVGSAPSDTLQINAGGGNDHVDVADAVTDLIALSVDLGSGQR